MTAPKKQNLKQKLCFVLPEYSEKTHFRYVAEFARALAEDVDVFLVVEKGDRSIANAFPGRCYVQRCTSVVGRTLEHIAVLKLLRFRGYKKFYIHYSFVSAISAGLITKVLGGTVYYWNAGMPWKYPRGMVRGFMERLAYKLVDYLVTGAHALVPGYSSYYGIPKERIIVIPNWVESPHVHADSLQAMVSEDIAKPKEAHVLLFVHRLAKRKGAHYLPEILHRLKDENVVLGVVGDGPERERINEECKRLGVAHKLRMLGERTSEYVEEAFTQADVFLLPSQEEGSPHSLLEAMATGVPCVAFNVGGVHEHTPPSCTSYVVPEGDVPEFVSKVKTLLHDREEHARCREAEQEWVGRFSKERILRVFKEKILHHERA